MANNIPVNKPIELVYTIPSESRVIVQFPNGLKGRAVFGKQDHFLEEAMKQVGIVIPTNERGRYPEFKNNSNRQSIYLTDASFGKAFYEVYFKQRMDPTLFIWNQLSKKTD